MCGIYLLALYTPWYLPVTSSACLPAAHIRTYLRTYINTYPLTHLPTYRSIYPSIPSHYPSIHPSKYLSGYLIPESFVVSENRISALLIKKFATLRVENDHSCVCKSPPMPHILKHTNTLRLHNICLNIIRLLTISLSKSCYEFSHLTHTCYEFCLLHPSSFHYSRLIILHATIILAVAFHAYKTWQVAMTVGHESQTFENKILYIISYRIASYIIYHHITSYHIISYHIISYYIILIQYFLLTTAMIWSVWNISKLTSWSKLDRNPKTSGPSQGEVRLFKHTWASHNEELRHS